MSNFKDGVLKSVNFAEGNLSVVLNPDKCVGCTMCQRTCMEINQFDWKTGYETGHNPVCINCGQCSSVCPTGALTEVYNIDEALAAIADPDKIVVASTAPAVRVGLGEEFGLPAGSFVEGQMVSLLRELGCDYVLDVNFSADLTIVEEASELIERITKGTGPLPQYTSCCPGWVKYAETYHPEILPNISTAKSPISMQGPVIKTYFAKKMGIDPSKIVNLVIAPCTAKKYEIKREEFNDAAKYLNIPGLRDNDIVLTTRELAKVAKEKGINLAELPEKPFDKLLGEASGAGQIFGNTGGVMEAALRTAYEFITKEKAPEVLYNLEPVRGLTGVKEASLMVGDLEVKVAVCYGTANAAKVIEAVEKGEKSYHFIEVMACPGGCISGGGQPKMKLPQVQATRESRIASLYKHDAEMTLRLSHENSEIKALYNEMFDHPLSELAEEMLHTSYVDRSKDLK